MLLPDVNVLVYAFRADMERHDEYRTWLLALVNSDEPYALSELVLSGFLRVVTHRRLFREPSRLESALEFLGELRTGPGLSLLAPGPRHWDIFTDLCRRVNARGNLVPDAYLAALAIETGSEWITTDGDFARFPGLRWRHPLDA
jgi:toxin-antitoxin system PIN domain toxin